MIGLIHEFEREKILDLVQFWERSTKFDSWQHSQYLSSANIPVPVYHSIDNRDIVEKEKKYVKCIFLLHDSILMIDGLSVSIDLLGFLKIVSIFIVQHFVQIGAIGFYFSNIQSPIIINRLEANYDVNKEICH